MFATIFVFFPHASPAIFAVAADCLDQRVASSYTSATHAWQYPSTALIVPAWIVFIMLFASSSVSSDPPLYPHDEKV